MIKNVQELRRVSEEMSRRIKADMRRKIVQFMEQMGTNEVELARALDITVNELNVILQGNGEITLTTFAKILVASDHALEIKQIPVARHTPNGRNSSRVNHRPTNGERIPSYEEFQRMVREGRIPPPPHGMHMRPMNEMPIMPRPERNVGHQHVQEREAVQPCPMMEANMELESMSRDELISTIENNGLGHEFISTRGVNPTMARRGDLINFLLEKNFHVEEEPMPMEAVRAPFAQEVTEQAPINERQEPSVADLAQTFAEMLIGNPQLRENLKRML